MQNDSHGIGLVNAAGRRSARAVRLLLDARANPNEANRGDDDEWGESAYEWPEESNAWEQWDESNPTEQHPEGQTSFVCG